MKGIRTGILDDHPLFVEGIAEILNNYSQMEVVFTGNSGKQLMTWLAGNPLDLLLLDISLSGENGLDVLKQLRDAYPSVQVIIFTTHQPSDIGLSMDDMNADGYVLKISGRKVLEDAFECIKSGKVFLDPNLLPFHKKTEVNPYRLTKREQEIISLITSGKTTREIAEKLNLSEMTVKTHRRNISEKMGGRNVADLFYKMNKLQQDH